MSDIMNMKGTELIRELSLAFGPTGCEDAVRELIRPRAEALADKVSVDRMGDLVAKMSFGKLLESNPEFAKAIFAIGRGGKKPRKDLTTWADAKAYMGFFFDELFTIEDAYEEKYDRADIKATLEKFLATLDMADDSNVWFEKIKAIGAELGYTADMKAYKADPAAFKGSVADVSMFIRVAVTGKLNSPDMYSVIQILGRDRVSARIENMINSL